MSVPTSVRERSGKKRESAQSSSEPDPTLVMLTRGRDAWHVLGLATIEKAQQNGEGRGDENDTERRPQRPRKMCHRQKGERPKAEHRARQRSTEQAADRGPMDLFAQRVRAAAKELHHTRDEHVRADRERQRNPETEDERRRHQRTTAGRRRTHHEPHEQTDRRDQPRRDFDVGVERFEHGTPFKTERLL
jgi:hypothetical protein